MKRSALIVLMLLAFMSGAFLSHAQSAHVVVTVRDALTKKPIEGAAVVLTSSEYEDGESTGANGRFEGDVTPNRYAVHVSVLGYEPFSSELLAVSGKTTTLSVELEERTTQLEAVVIESRAYATSNEASVVLPIEKVLRMPANFFDPVRMLTSYPGVVAANDQANHIVVKGNSPNGLLWKLNGMDILNPNHLANAGTLSDRPIATGGGVNILSAQMLDNTSFFSGDIPARYGNATGGVLDMTLREGTEHKVEYTAQASLIGLDVAAEGPMGKGASFLANARYSTVGLLSKLGVNFGGEEITFQDFSFNTKKNIGARGKLSFFGLGGVSSNYHANVPQADWEIDKDRFDIDYKSATTALGLKYDATFGKGYALTIGSTWSRNTQERYAFSPHNVLDPANDWLRTRSNLLSSIVSLSGKVSSSVAFEAGAMLNYYDLHLEDDVYRSGTGSWVSDNDTPLSSTNALIQPYAQLAWSYKRLRVQGSAHHLYSTLTSQNMVDFRGRIRYLTGNESIVSLAAGEVSQQLQTGVNFVRHVSLGYFTKRYAELDYRFAVGEWSFQPAVYYHNYADVPLGAFGYTSVLNSMGEYGTDELRNGGTGENKGVTLQAERRFVNGFYILTGASFYDSKFSNIEFSDMPTRFAGRYNAMITAGREKAKERKSGRNAFGVHTRFMVMGGMRDMPIDETASLANGITTYGGMLTSNPFPVTMNDYIRLDLRLSWRKDKEGYTRTIGVDIQNLTGMKNEAYFYYDQVKRAVNTQYQVGIIPVLVYRVDF